MTVFFVKKAITSYNGFHPDTKEIKIFSTKAELKKEGFTYITSNYLDVIEINNQNFKSKLQNIGYAYLNDDLILDLSPSCDGLGRMCIRPGHDSSIFKDPLGYGIVNKINVTPSISDNLTEILQRQVTINNEHYYGKQFLNYDHDSINNCGNYIDIPDNAVLLLAEKCSYHTE
ncbi:hypothetical protein NOVO_01875 [Rickettsiales bacterium Ac37b]|nr:hypothetical protein NOVO_01875 [Rickettsiales bacterium Ac37b]